MKILALAIALFAVQACPARGEETATIRVIDCGEKICVVVASDFIALLKSNDANYERAQKAEAEAKQLREIKGCAKLEVTEPPKNFVPRKERDS